jgi:hypothetical protein
MEYPWRTWRRWVNILSLLVFMSANISAKVFGLAEFLARINLLFLLDFLYVRQLRQGIWVSLFFLVAEFALRQHPRPSGRPIAGRYFEFGFCALDGAPSLSSIPRGGPNLFRRQWAVQQKISFPLYIMLGFRYAPTHSETPKWLLCNGGPAVTGAQRPNLRRKVMAALAAHLPELIEKHNARYLEAWIPAQAPFLHGPAAPRANPLYHLGFENTSGATWMIDLAPMAEEIRRRYSEMTRRHLKKANRASFTLREAAGSRDLETYYDLHLETVRRLESEPEPFEFFQAIFERMLPQKFARIVIGVRSESIWIGAATCQVIKIIVSQIEWPKSCRLRRWKGSITSWAHIISCERTPSGRDQALTRLNVARSRDI